MNKNWKILDAPSLEETQALAEAINIDTNLAALLIQRGITDY